VIQNVVLLIVLIGAPLLYVLTGSWLIASGFSVIVCGTFLVCKRFALQKSAQQHEDRLQAIAAWEKANMGKPKEEWSPLP
jgi:hypothetical protein